MDRGQPTQVGGALTHLDVEHIAAYSPQARVRSKRLFQTLQDRVPKELALAGIVTRDAANAYTSAQRTVRGNRRTERQRVRRGGGLDLAEIPCVQDDRAGGNDNCVSFLNRKLDAGEPAASALREGDGKGA